MQVYWEYDEMGGYDCMSSAFKIKPIGSPNQTLCVFDLADYDCGMGWGVSKYRLDKIAEVQAIVQMFVDRFNKG